MNNNNKINLDGFPIILTIFFSAWIIVLFVAGTGAIISEKNYKNAIKEPPPISFIEEDLEDVFLTKDVEFIESDDYLQDGNYVCVVKANGLFFKIEYHLTSSAIRAKWKFQKYIQISEPKEIIK